jgi:hypothetical protein
MRIPTVLGLCAATVTLAGCFEGPRGNKGDEGPQVGCRTSGPRRCSRIRRPPRGSPVLRGRRETLEGQEPPASISGS